MINLSAATGLNFLEDKGWGRGRQPAINLSWLDAGKFSEWLSKETGKRYRLPTEAEWEYAARAGTVTTYWWGNEIKPDMANFLGGDNRWGGKQTSPVGSFQPNAFGLYDTAGNVWEWVQDSWHENYIGASSDGSAWESSDIGQRVVRGGSWDYRPEDLRSSIPAQGTAPASATTASAFVSPGTSNNRGPFQSFQSFSRSKRSACG